MFHPFVSVPSRRHGDGAAVSLVVHAVLITTFVATSGHVVIHSRSAEGEVEERVHYTSLTVPHAGPEVVAKKVAKGAPRRAARPTALERLDQLVSALPPMEFPTEIPTSLPAPDSAFAAMVDGGSTEFDAAADTAFARILGRAYARPGGNGAYLAEVVERTVWPRRGNPVPAYPTQLMNMGVEGNFFVSFVVDSTGKVDRGTISFPREIHSLFMSAIRVALARSRYYPAEIGGKPVAQLVQQQFKFALRR